METEKGSVEELKLAKVIQRIFGIRQAGENGTMLDMIGVSEEGLGDFRFGTADARRFVQDDRIPWRGQNLRLRAQGFIVHAKPSASPRPSQRAVDNPIGPQEMVALFPSLHLGQDRERDAFASQLALPIQLTQERREWRHEEHATTPEPLRPSDHDNRLAQSHFKK